ncbi:MAG: ABC transporter ATP-binding protein [Saprospiraceae bacterium]|nr:ABC transporter ATP-binding protein [Candidatus Vicinibacter affinis]
MDSGIIEITQLSKTYKDILAVDHLDLVIPANCIYGFLGPNGAGKSTTLRMMLSLISPDNGIIKVFGKDLNQHRKQILSRIGSIIEKPDFYLYLTGIENLNLLARLSGIRPNSKKIEELLDLVGLSSRGKHKVGTYSHGMKQRLGIAQAIIHNPDLVILDEPTTGLDPSGILELRQMILNLKHSGKTVILSSHILSEIELIADHMVIMNKGKALVQGNVQTLINDQELVVVIETNNTPRAVDRIRNNWPIVGAVEISPSELQCQAPKALIADINKVLIEEGINVYSIYYKRKLEDYFFKLTSN